MTWLKLYQSDKCWLLPEELTAPSHSLIVPQVQMSGRPMASNVAAVTATIRAAISHALLRMFSFAAMAFPR